MITDGFYDVLITILNYDIESDFISLYELGRIRIWYRILFKSYVLDYIYKKKKLKFNQ